MRPRSYFGPPSPSDNVCNGGSHVRHAVIMAALIGAEIEVYSGNAGV